MTTQKPQHISVTVPLISDSEPMAMANISNPESGVSKPS